MDLKNCNLNCKFAKKINAFDTLGKPIDNLFECSIYGRMFLAVGELEHNISRYYIQSRETDIMDGKCNKYEKEEN